MQKDCLTEADHWKLPLLPKTAEKKKQKKQKKKNEGREITNKGEQISSPNNFECLDVPLF